MTMTKEQLEELRKKEFITVKEATQLTGLSVRSLRRFVALKVQSSDPEDEKYYSKQSLPGGKFFYLLKREAVEEHFKRALELKAREEEGEKESEETGPLLQQTVNMLERELEAKNKQIDNLQNLLVAKEAVLGQLQTKMLLLENSDKRVVEGEEVKKKVGF